SAGGRKRFQRPWYDNLGPGAGASCKRLSYSPGSGQKRYTATEEPRALSTKWACHATQTPPSKHCCPLSEPGRHSSFRRPGCTNTSVLPGGGLKKRNDRPRGDSNRGIPKSTEENGTRLA
ncbi:unnamed protein product, partial [Ectocarpus fasciculatus]